MKISINGKEEDIEGGYLLSDLLTDLRVTGQFAVEINGEIIPRTNFDTRIISENDKLEVVKAVGGG